MRVTRPAGSFVDGRWEESAPKVFEITASFQPLSGQDLKSLPEGRARDGVFCLYTDTELRTADDGRNYNADRVADAKGNVYEVIQVFPWQNGIRSHYKAVISLLEKAPDGE